MKAIATLCGAVAFAGLTCSPARAQTPYSAPVAESQIQAANGSGFVFNVAPYLWLPTANATLNYKLPPGLDGRVPTDVSAGPGDYLSHLNFAAMGAADVRYGAFSLLTDFVYTNFSATGGASHIKSVDFLGQPALPISRDVQTGLGTTLKATIWTLAGGYTVLNGDWGNVDVLVGLRGAQINARTNYSLAVSITGPRGNGPSFGGTGYVGAIENVWNGIAGVRARIKIGDQGFYLPFYADVGGGGSQPTWQIAGGVGYQTGWAGVSLTYRYLAFDQGSSRTVKNLSLGGPLLMATFTF
ncbi:MAG: hypothetical protein JSR21_07080 [Proteobacteria bacterium]|nr:hypothetical protein [Pseudomonadota bacterium]